MIKSTTAGALLVAFSTACGHHDSTPVNATSRGVLDLRAVGEASRSDTPPEQLEAIQSVADGLEDGMLQASYQRNFGSSVGPCTVVLDKLASRVDDYAASLKSGKTKAAESALEKAKAEVNKIMDYHVRTAMKDGNDSATARRMAAQQTWIDYQTINPLVGALQGRRPTAAEYAQLRQRFTPEKARIADVGIEAWKQGSLALFGRPGPITQEDARTR